MRIVPGTDTVPNVVNRYLLPHEHQVITVRRHPAVLIKPIIISLVGLAIAAVVSTTVARNNSTAVGFVWIAWAVLLLWLVYKVIEWSVDYFIVTSRRMLLASGVFTRKVAMMPLVKVTDMSFQRSTLGRMLGYGEFILESAGQDQALRVVDHLPYPEQLYLEVCGLIFPGKDDEEEPPKCPVCKGEKVVTVMDRGQPAIALCPKCGGTGIDPDWRRPPLPGPDSPDDSEYDD
jgi:membrane protein YdbS with pleckstrin-like domain